ATIRLADCGPERLVMDVEHPSAMEGPGRDRSCEAALHELLDEVRTLLTMHDSRELAVLALNEDTRVQQHVQKEPCLALRETKRRDSLHALSVGLFDDPTVGRARQVHRRNSSANRGSGVLPPRRPPTAPPKAR